MILYNENVVVERTLADYIDFYYEGHTLTLNVPDETIYYNTDMAYSDLDRLILKTLEIRYNEGWEVADDLVFDKLYNWATYQFYNKIDPTLNEVLYDFFTKIGPCIHNSLDPTSEHVTNVDDLVSIYRCTLHQRMHIQSVISSYHTDCLYEYFYDELIKLWEDDETYIPTSDL